VHDDKFNTRVTIKQVTEGRLIDREFSLTRTHSVTAMKKPQKQVLSADISWALHSDMPFSAAIKQ
jgi:hypothetical protein